MSIFLLTSFSNQFFDLLVKSLISPSSLQYINSPETRTHLGFGFSRKRNKRNGHPTPPKFFEITSTLRETAT